jgi:hypothetical protein
MRNKLWLSLFIAVGLISLLTVAVTAQNTVIDDEAEEQPSAAFVEFEPITATLRQRVPISVTLRIPLGATETQTVTIPLLLNLDLQISLGEWVSPALTLTADVGPLTPLTPTVAALVTPVSTPANTATPTLPPPTATPTLPPPPPTATPVLTTTEPITVTEPVTEPTPPPADETTTVIVPECGDPRSIIVFPGVGQVLSGTVDVTGSATHESFQYYKLEYALGANASSAAEFFYFGGGNSPVENGLLAPLDTQAMPNGDYTLRLTVVDNTGNFPTPCLVSVVVQN